MKSSSILNSHHLIRFSLTTFTAVLFVQIQTAVWAAGTVNTCNESALRSAMAGGGEVHFACDGTITLANTITILTDTVLDGSGHGIIIDGSDSLRVFQVVPNVTVTMLHLTIRNGHTQNGSNGLYGTDGSPGEPGGGFYNSGTLTLCDCVVSSNRTGNGGYGTTLGMYGPYTAGGAGGPGGGIFNTGTLLLSNCLVSGNSTGYGGAGGGGLTYFPAGGNGGAGGGIYNAGTLYLEKSTICSNSTGYGVRNPLRGPGANGGMGGGIWTGGIFRGNNSTLNGNITGYGGQGGPSDMIGGPGGAGGAGGAIANTGMLVLTNCTFTDNSTGDGGFGGGSVNYSGSPGPAGSGGGIYNQTNVVLVNCSMANNRAGSGGAELRVAGSGGGIGNVGGVVQLLNTIVARNLGNPHDVAGIFPSLGHNLIGTTNGSSGLPISGDVVGSDNLRLDPKLGPLADNGGPTWTMALLSGSPAIDAGKSAGAPATDQRGVTRPQGPGVDIGAFEYQYVPVFTGAKFQSATNFWLQLFGLLPGHAFTLQTSTNLLDWMDATNFVAGDSGGWEFIDHCPNQCATRFYRLKLSDP